MSIELINVEQPEHWDAPLSKWYRENIIDLIDEVK